MAGFTRVKVRDLKRGMMVDLQGDPFADPEQENHSYEFEYAVVEDPDPDPDMVVVEFRDGSLVGFPPDHELVWNGEWFYLQAEED
jgi:hypothetical protein